MRIWFREIKDNHTKRELTVENFDSDTRTHKVFDAVDKMCRDFDLPVPIWLNGNIEDFKRGAHTRFRQDSFMEETDFDYIDMLVLEEDY